MRSVSILWGQINRNKMLTKILRQRLEFDQLQSSFSAKLALYRDWISSDKAWRCFETQLQSQRR